jgi:hypothetical protein
VDKKQFDLLLEVLRRFQEKGILQQLILAGSWGMMLYRRYAEPRISEASLRTRDADFIIPSSFKKRSKANLPELLQDLGFIIEFHRADNSMRLLHPALIIEFLVPEAGRQSAHSKRIKELGITAQRLRYLGYLERKVITINIEGLMVRVPDPAVFALHKLIVMERRQSEEKRDKDKQQAIVILRHLIKSKMDSRIKDAIRLMHPRWFQGVLRNLKKENEQYLLNHLNRIAELGDEVDEQALEDMGTSLAGMRGDIERNQ